MGKVPGEQVSGDIPVTVFLTQLLWYFGGFRQRLYYFSLGPARHSTLAGLQDVEGGQQKSHGSIGLNFDFGIPTTSC